MAPAPGGEAPPAANDDSADSEDDDSADSEDDDSEDDDSEDDDSADSEDNSVSVCGSLAFDWGSGGGGGGLSCVDAQPEPYRAMARRSAASCQREPVCASGIDVSDLRSISHGPPDTGQPAPLYLSLESTPHRVPGGDCGACTNVTI